MSHPIKRMKAALRESERLSSHMEAQIKKIEKLLNNTKPAR
jgi:hypothetical protein